MAAHGPCHRHAGGGLAFAEAYACEHVDRGGCRHPDDLAPTRSRLAQGHAGGLRSLDRGQRRQGRPGHGSGIQNPMSDFDDIIAGPYRRLRHVREVRGQARWGDICTSDRLATFANAQPEINKERISPFIVDKYSSSSKMKGDLLEKRYGDVQYPDRPDTTDLEGLCNGSWVRTWGRCLRRTFSLV